LFHFLSHLQNLPSLLLLIFFLVAKMLQVAMEICRKYKFHFTLNFGAAFLHRMRTPCAKTADPWTRFLAIFLLPCSWFLDHHYYFWPTYTLIQCAVGCLSDYALRSKYAKDNQRKQTDGAGNGDRVRCINCTNIYPFMYECAHISQHIYIYIYIYIGVFKEQGNSMARWLY